MMRKPLALALIVTVVALLAYLTKPSDEKCKERAIAAWEDKMYATAAGLPASVNQALWKETLAKAFKESLLVEDKFIYKAIYQQNNAVKKFIGWGALGFVQVEIK